jgi:hypothetical protein
MLHTKLILIDGIPGSGKSTTGKMLADKLDNLRISNRFYHELEENHPLRIYDKQFTSFTIEEEAEWFAAKVKKLFETLVQDLLEKEEITIMESYVFQDTLGFAYFLGMPHERILELSKTIQTILHPLNLVLIYYYQLDVEQNWRHICEIRGPKFAHDRCGLFTDEDFVKAGQDWTANQDFMMRMIQSWDIRKLVIKNQDYCWDEYNQTILNFLQIGG